MKEAPGERRKTAIASNRRARRAYEILDTIEAGLVLRGTEVKSLRARRANLGDAYAIHRDGEIFLVNLHISPYTEGNRENHEPMRERKLLLGRREIDRLRGRIEAKGLTLVPLELYFSGPYAKVLLALARGKKVYDRREDIAKRDADREVERALRRRDR